MKILTFLLTIILMLLSQQVFSVDLEAIIHQQVSCTSNDDCNEGFIFPILTCQSGTCVAPPNLPEFRIQGLIVRNQPAGGTCRSIRECNFGLVCISGNPTGTCGRAEGVIGLGHLVVNLIQEDYTPGTEESSPVNVRPTPTQGTPLLTSRAIAIIFLSFHDTYGILTRSFKPRIINEIIRRGITTNRGGIYNYQQQIIFASQIAGYTAARLLYPESKPRIDAIEKNSTAGVLPAFKRFGELVGKAWFKVRLGDGSERPLLDEKFALGVFLRHQPDPNFPIVQNKSMMQDNLGRFWGQVRPFALSDVRKQAFLERFPGPDTMEYRDNLTEVRTFGECNDFRDNRTGELVNDIGVFWGYDAAPQIGVPPRLYLQVVLAVKELNALPIENQVRALTAVAVAMVDAGIAAWFWKFFYDLWRPVLGIRNDTVDPDPDWNPRGVPLSNIGPVGVPENERPPFCVGINPNFPAYPSGHASFGTAAFRVLAKVLSMRPEDIVVTFTSDEFNGVTVEGTTGLRRQVLTQTFSLAEGIEQNKDARVFIGVHWRFDSDGGDTVGTQVANIVARQFSLGY